MNCTSQNAEPAITDDSAPTQSSVLSPQSFSDWLPGEIRARCLPVESEATPIEVIPWVHKFLKRHVEIEVPEGCESHKLWKATLDDWQSFLNKLQQLKKAPFPDEPISHPKNFSPKKQPQSENAFANQRSAADNEVRTSDNEVRKGENEAIIGEKILTSTENASPQNSPTSPPPDGDSKKQSAPKSSATSMDLNDADDAIEEDADDNNDADEENEEDADNKDEADEENLLDLADYLDDESLQAALDLREYLSGRSQLDKLEPRIQQILLHLMEDHQPEHIAEVIAEPPPIGLGIQTSQAALYRFRDRYTQAKERSQKDQHTKAVQDLLAKANDTDEAFQAAVQRVLKTRLLTITTDPNCDLESIGSLINSLTKLRKQSLAEHKQLHAEKTK